MNRVSCWTLFFNDTATLMQPRPFSCACWGKMTCQRPSTPTSCGALTRPFGKFPYSTVLSKSKWCAARCNNLIEPSHHPTRQQPRRVQRRLWTRCQRGEERSQPGFKRRRQTREFLALHARLSNLGRQTRTTIPASLRRDNQTAAFLLWKEAMRKRHENHAACRVTVDPLRLVARTALANVGCC